VIDIYYFKFIVVMKACDQHDPVYYRGVYNLSVCTTTVNSPFACGEIKQLLICYFYLLCIPTLCLHCT